MEGEQAIEKGNQNQKKRGFAWVILILLIIGLSGAGYWWFFKRGRVSVLGPI